jgi:hypothetical protein
MDNKVTAVIITGTPEEVSSLINSSFKNMTQVSFFKNSKPSTNIKYKYHRPTNNYSLHDLDSDQIQAVDNYLAKKSSFRFFDLMTNLKRNSNIYTPSYAAISNYLTDCDYSRYHIVTNSNKSYYSWEKN